MAPEAINELFETMALGLRTSAAGGAQPPAAGAPSIGAPPAAPPPPPERMDYKKLLDPSDPDFNPEKAFGHFVQKNYGSLVGDLSRRSIRGMYPMMQQELGDFNDYQSEVDGILAPRDPSTVTERDVLAAYFTAKGMKTTIKERAARAAKSGATTLAPTPAGGEGKDKKIELSTLEKDVAHRMFGAEADPEGKYAEWVTRVEEGNLQMKVPVGGGKKE